MADPLIAYTPANVLVGEAAMYLAPASTAGPADTVSIGTAWSTPWVPIGSTDSGVQLTWSRTTSDVRIEEQSLPVARNVETSNLTVAVTFAEDTIENMKYAYGGGTITTVAASTGVPGTKTLALSDSLDQMALGFEGKNQFGFWRRVIVPIVVSTGTVQTNYRRVAGARLYPASFDALCKPGDISIKTMTAAAL